MKKNDNNTKKERRGVFIALAICLVSIGVASIGTYNNVSSYIDEQNSETEVQEESADIQSTPDEASDTLLESEEDIDDEVITAEDDDPEAVVESQSTDADITVKETESDDTEEVSQTNTEVQSYTLSSTYSLPVASMTILQGYSGDTLVYNETMKDYRTHNGVDITSYVGETVYAVNNGLVLETFTDLLLGNVVSIEHGDYEVWYCGLGSTFLVEAGDIIDQGTAIGSVKEVPFEASEETHIHIEVRVDGELIDPLSIDFF